LPSDQGMITEDSTHAKFIRSLFNLKTFVDRSPTMLAYFI